MVILFDLGSKIPYKSVSFRKRRVKNERSLKPYSDSMLVKFELSKTLDHIYHICTDFGPHPAFGGVFDWGGGIIAPIGKRVYPEPIGNRVKNERRRV